MATGTYVLAVDLGGTRMRVAAFGTPGEPPLTVVRTDSESAKGPQFVIDKIVATALGVIEEQPGMPLAIGVAAPGPLDPYRGVVFAPPNMPGWAEETPLAAILTERLGIPAVIGNDANLAALGEHQAGAGKGHDDLVYFTVSTGIGGGVINGGRLLLGSGGLAAELGHMVIEPDGPRCNCGGRGCLEALASGTSIARIANEQLRAGAVSSLPADGTVRTEDVERAARAGDAFAAALFRESARYLGIGVVNALHVFDPALVILGGGVSNAGELLFDPVREMVRELAMPRYVEKFRLARAGLRDDAGLYGAAAVAWARTDG